MTGIVSLCTQFRRGTESVRDSFGGALVVGGEGNADVAIVQDRVVLAVGFCDLVERLRDQISEQFSRLEEIASNLEYLRLKGIPFCGSPSRPNTRTACAST